MVRDRSPNSIATTTAATRAAMATDVAWDLIRLAWASVADLAITPLQDILDLGTEARMNIPGMAQGNWRAGECRRKDLRIGQEAGWWR